MKLYSTPGTKVPPSESEYTGLIDDTRHLVDLVLLFSLWTMIDH